MGYDHFGASVKSTEVALAAFADAVELVKSYSFSGSAFMKPATTLPAVRVASSSVRDLVLVATVLLVKPDNNLTFGIHINQTFRGEHWPA